MTTKNLLDFPKTEVLNSDGALHVSSGGIDYQIKADDLTASINGGRPQTDYTFKDSASSARLITTADRNSYITFTNVSGCAVSINPLSLDVGDSVVLKREGGVINVNAVDGAVLNGSASGTSLTETGQLGQIFCKAVGVYDFVTGGNASDILQGNATCLDVANLIAGVTVEGSNLDYSVLAAQGSVVQTTYNNLTSKAGGASYIVKTLVQAGLDGDVIDGVGGIGGNHACADGVNCVVLSSFGRLKISQFGGTEAGAQKAFEFLNNGDSLVFDSVITNENNYLIEGKDDIRIYFEAGLTSNCRSFLLFNNCKNPAMYDPVITFSDTKNQASNLGTIPDGWKNFGIVFYICYQSKIHSPQIELNGVLPVSGVGGEQFEVFGGQINDGGDNSVYAFNCKNSRIITTSKNTRAGRAIALHRAAGHTVVATIEGGAGFGVSAVGASNSTIVATCSDIAFDSSILFNRAAVSIEGNEQADVTEAELNAADADPSLINNAYSRNVTATVTAHNCGDGVLVGLGPRGNNGSVVVNPHITDCSNGVKLVDARGLNILGGSIKRMSEAGVRIQSPALSNLSEFKCSDVQFEDVDGGGAGYNSIHKDGGITTEKSSVLIERNTYTQADRRSNITNEEATFIDDWPTTPTETIKQVGNTFYYANKGTGLTADPAFQNLIDLSGYVGTRGIVDLTLTMGDADRRPIGIATMKYNRLTDTVYAKTLDADSSEDVTISAGVVQVLVNNSAVLGYGSAWRLQATITKES